MPNVKEGNGTYVFILFISSSFFSIHPINEKIEMERKVSSFASDSYSQSCLTHPPDFRKFQLMFINNGHVIVRMQQDLRFLKLLCLYHNYHKTIEHMYVRFSLLFFWCYKYTRDVSLSLLQAKGRYLS